MSPPVMEVTPPGLHPEQPLTKVRELAPHLNEVEQARDKVTKVRLQVVERVRRGLLTSESANALIQDAEMELERAEQRFDQARYEVGKSGRKRKMAKSDDPTSPTGPRKVII